MLMSRRDNNKKSYSDLKTIRLRPIVFCSIIFLCLGMLLGWSFYKIGSMDGISLKALRLEGYNFISPLLVCDTTDEKSKELEPIGDKIRTLVDKKIQSGDINIASVYVRDFNTGGTLNINPSEKYYPASLNKIPVLIAYLKAAEKDPEILGQKISLDESADGNANQEIMPKDYLKPGKAYTVEEALEKMIKYSDNNAFFLLADRIDIDILESTYKDLKISFPQEIDAPPDFMTAKDFSYFLRILYNATYLKKDFSEKALELLSDIDFKDGLVAGLPQNVLISHKFGLQTEEKNGIRYRELHDCGIIYNPERPYLVCVMSKGSSNLEKMEKTIQHISKLIYNDLKK
jgi:beta-lactamase class A